MVLREDYHQTRERLVEYKARVVEATAISDALNAIQRGAERSDALGRD